MNIVEFQTKDKAQVFSLFEKAFQKKITEGFWDWRYSYFGKPIRQVMKDNNNVIGHYCVHPIPLYRYPNTNQALFSMSVMSHPEYRGQKIFEKLAKIVYSIAKDKNYKIIYGFPNRNSAGIHFQKLRWYNLGNPTEYKKTVKQNENLPVISNYKIKKVVTFSNVGDMLWQKYKNHHDVFMVPRTSNYLKWRFELSPEQRFQNYKSEKYYLYVIEENSEKIAYFVLKKFGNDKVHLVDYFGKLTLDVVKNIINYSIKFTKQENIKEISFWHNQCLENLELEKISDEFNFENEKAESYFGVKLLDSDTECLGMKKWFITMSDSDVY